MLCISVTEFLSYPENGKSQYNIIHDGFNNGLHNNYNQKSVKLSPKML